MRTVYQALMLIVFLAAANAALAGGWVLTTDYTTFGGIRSFAGAAPWSMSGDLASIPGDPAGRWHEGLVYVLGRGGSNVLQVYDPGAGFALVREFSLGAGRNPQDIAFDAAGEAYVSCYDQAVLLRVDVEGETVLDAFDTSHLADADGLPETAWMIAVGDRLFVSVQKLDRDNWYEPTGPGAVAVFDTATETWVDADAGTPGVQPIALTAANPYTRFDPVRSGSGDLVLRVGCLGSFAVQDGAVEDVDPQSLTSLGPVATEAQLGGDVIGQVTVGGDLFVLVSGLSGMDFVTSLRRYAPVGGQLTVLDSGAGYDHADLAWDGGFQLYVADRATGGAGLRVFDVTSGAELTALPIPTGLPPFMFVLPGYPGVSPVPRKPPRGDLTLGLPAPNPANPRSILAVRGAPNAPVTLRVFDLRGRKVRSERLVLDGAGSGSFIFGGRDRAGRPLASGTYRVTVQDASGFAARSVTLVR